MSSTGKAEVIGAPRHFNGVKQPFGYLHARFDERPGRFVDRHVNRRRIVEGSHNQVGFLNHSPFIGNIVMD